MATDEQKEGRLIDRLGSRVEAMVSQVQTLRKENGRLEQALKAAETENELCRAKVAKLEEENALNEREIEAIVKKIEGLLG